MNANEDSFDSSDPELTTPGRWFRAGELSLDGKGKLVFPEAATLAEPGLYRYLTSEGDGYVGQARVTLRRRFRGYRRSSGRPANSRLTTRRNAHLLRSVLIRGGTVTLDLRLAANPGLDALERKEIRNLLDMPGVVNVMNRSHVADRAAPGDTVIELRDGVPYIYTA